jgi:CRISPR-associated protein Cas5d
MPLSERVRVKLWGEFACFTRPELKVERVSYPVMTPSAARGVLEAILWKPEFRWVIEEIAVLRPVRYIGLRRNEVQVKASTPQVMRFIREGRDPNTFPPLLADSRGPGGVATQRNTLALRDVAYIVTARALVRDAAAAENPPRKYVEMFERRVERGQCFQQPYLGCREFAACFGPPDGDDQPLPESQDLGLMLYDIIFSAGKEPNVPVFFQARIENGVLDARPEVAVPDPDMRARLGLC